MLSWGSLALPRLGSRRNDHRVLSGYGLGEAVGASLGPKGGVGRDAPRPVRRCLDEEKRLNPCMPLPSGGKVLGYTN